MSQGFIKLNREGAIELLKEDPKAYLLLTQIALRAKRTNKNYSKIFLKTNQALIGDQEMIGLTNQEYRNAKKRLMKYGLATFKSCSRGTIATLISTDVYDINAEEFPISNPSNFSMKTQDSKLSKARQRTIKEPIDIYQRAIDEPLTRKQECKKATTPPVEDAFLYNVLQNCSQLSDIEKHGLMKYPEDCVKKAIEWAAKVEIKTTLIQTLHWHCQQTTAPLLPEKTSTKTPQESAAWEFNRFLESHGKNQLAIKNRETIPKQVAHIISGGIETTISLNNSIDVIRNDFKDSMNEILKHRK